MRKLLALALLSTQSKISTSDVFNQFSYEFYQRTQIIPYSKQSSDTTNPHKHRDLINYMPTQVKFNVLPLLLWKLVEEKRYAIWTKTHSLSVTASVPWHKTKSITNPEYGLGIHGILRVKSNFVHLIANKYFNTHSKNNFQNISNVGLMLNMQNIFTITYLHHTKQWIPVTDTKLTGERYIANNVTLSQFRAQVFLLTNLAVAWHTCYYTPFKATIDTRYIHFFSLSVRTPAIPVLKTHVIFTLYAGKPDNFKDLKSWTLSLNVTITNKPLGCITSCMDDFIYHDDMIVDLEDQVNIRYAEMSIEKKSEEVEAFKLLPPELQKSLIEAIDSSEEKAVEKWYKTNSLKYHPDKTAGDKAKAEIFKQMQIINGNGNAKKFKEQVESLRKIYQTEQS